MGAGSSGLALETDQVGLSPLRTNLDDVPESCVASIFMHLDPPEICKLARLNRAFHGASSADFVWETKLPSNYKYLAEKILGQSPESLSKKEIYARLCRPNCFDDGTKQVWLDKSSGKICVAVSYKALRITGIDDRRYWNHISSEESRFNTIAYLQQIWWLEVVGELEFEFPAGTYSLLFKLHLGKISKNPADEPVMSIKFMAGMLNQSDFNFRHRTASKPHQNAICINKEIGGITMSVNLLLTAKTPQ